jgi:hypothetical protein
VTIAITTPTTRTITVPGVNGPSSLSHTVVEDTKLAVIVDLPLHHLARTTRPKTRPSRLHQKSMKVARLNTTVDRRLLHSKVTTIHTGHTTALHRLLHSQAATTRTTDTALTAALAVAAVAGEEVHVVAVVPSAHPPALQPSCKT